MASTSTVFTNAIFGISSGDTAANLAAKSTSTIEEVYGQYPLIKMNVTQPTIPSNQGIAKDK